MTSVIDARGHGYAINRSRPEAESRLHLVPKIDGDHFRARIAVAETNRAEPVLLHRGDDAATAFFGTLTADGNLPIALGKGQLLCSLGRSKEEPLLMEAALNETDSSAKLLDPSVTSRKQLMSLRSPGLEPFSE